jgi:DNA-binding protein HU-beta
MNREDLYWRYAVQNQVTFSKAKEELDSLLTFMLGEVRRLEPGEQLFIRGFGTFMIRERKARTVRHPRSGKPIQVEEHCYPHFKFAKSFAGEIRKGK